ncbi:GNAT family N-acetyltransferase [Gaetbulibacter aestuarii]|uniref:GNAT family N-acetyltransferase n=1 Tax=Gaetbulibacter aestuarii TaxID=1502358 RepID=A0ABW7N1E1_9FLAO
MIQVTNHLFLTPIDNQHQKTLMELMKQIYPPPYKHLWVNEDSSWYLEKCFSKENLITELKEKDSFYSFVIFKQQPIGILRFVYNSQIPDPGNSKGVFLHRLYLHPDFHGKGIAQNLMGFVEEEAIQNDNHFIWLKAMDTQMQAIKFYKKLGFKTIGTERLDFKLMLRDFRGMIVMKKAL